MCTFLFNMTVGLHFSIFDKNEKHLQKKTCFSILEIILYLFSIHM
jgi:hypothetical protein